MRENYTLTRLFVVEPLSKGASLTLDRSQAHYLTTVLRKSVGDSVRLFNGKDGEWQADIVQQSKKQVTLTLTKHLRVQQMAPDIHLMFAPVRKHRTAFILEKATELGVSHICPVITTRTQFPKLNIEKSRAQIIEAAEQTERLDIPTLSVPQKLDNLLDGWTSQRRILFADEAGDAQPAIEALGSITGPMAILIGPEGGFDSKERQRVRLMDNVTPVSLGPRILRADTAALSLITLWQAVHGDYMAGHVCS